MAEDMSMSNDWQQILVSATIGQSKRMTAGSRQLARLVSDGSFQLYLNTSEKIAQANGK